MKRIKLSLLILLCLCLLLCGCANKANYSDHVPVDGEITIYFINSEGYRLTPYYEVLEEVDARAKIERVLYLLAYPPSGYGKVISNESQVINYEYEDGKVIVNCAISAESMRNVHDILFRAAIVQSLTSLPEVDEVAFEIAGQPLMDTSGKEVGYLGPDSFEDTVNQRLGEINITCYFTDITGKWLIPEHRNIKYPLDEPVAYYILKTLIEGPEENGHYHVLSPKLEIQKTTISDGVCYIYLPDTFLSETVDVDSETTIYAIVNTLSELPEISRVHFVVEGVDNPVYKNKISLAKAFSANLELIEKE